MTLRSVTLGIAGIAFVLTATAASAQSEGNPVVVIETSLGDITAELYRDKAPISVENFLAYVNDGFFPGTIFHRVIKGFMIQGGGLTQEMVRKETRAPVKNEATNGLGNERGTLAMARTAAVDSGTAQFFINTVNNRGLNNRGTTQAEYGYAVFGKVIAGLEVVDAIENTPTGTSGSYADVPSTPVIITAVTVKQ